jgi:transmembrane sensor
MQADHDGPDEPADGTPAAESSEPPARPPTWDELARFVAGESSSRQAAAIEQWAAADPAHARLLGEIGSIWGAARTSETPHDVEGILRGSKRRGGDLRLPLGASPADSLKETDDESDDRAAAPRGRTAPIARRSGGFAGTARGGGRSAAWAGAIAATLVVGLSLWVWVVRPRFGDDDAMPTHEWSTGAGQRLALQLGDGTRVTLAPGSRLRYADRDALGTGGAPRAVTLDGAAVFDVVHDDRHPFTVRAGSLITRDVGTRFAVRAYSTDDSVEVVVAVGEVTVQARPSAMRAAAEPLVLRAAERARADGSGRVSREAAVDTATALAWTAGRLVFHAVPMREVVPELRRWYGIDVRLGDASLANRRLTATFTREPAATVVASVAAAVDARTETDRGAVLFLAAR